MLHQCPCGGVVCNGWFDSEPPIFKRLRDHDFLSPMRAPRIADLAEFHLRASFVATSGTITAIQPDVERSRSSSEPFDTLTFQAVCLSN